MFDLPLLDAPLNYVDGDKLFLPELVVGVGAYGVVEKGVWLATKASVAVKGCMLEDATVMRLRAEARVLVRCQQHPFVVKLVAVLQSQVRAFFVMEACLGGDLYNRFHFGMAALSKPEIKKHALFYLRELVCALDDLHESGVVHGDLKVENVLIDADGHIQLADFGGAITGVKQYRFVRGLRGSPLHFPPEMLKHQIASFASDVWALGCVAFELFTDLRPLEFDAAAGFSPTLQMLDHVNVDADADDFVRTLLHEDPTMRPSVKRLKAHPLFAGTDWEAVRAKALPVPWVPSGMQADAECAHMAVEGLPSKVALFSLDLR